VLVLSRKVKQTISLPDLGIKIHVTQIKGNSIRIGVEAPNEIRVVRGELEVKELDANGLAKEVAKCCEQ
jgi:carbon storage regulator